MTKPARHKIVYRPPASLKAYEHNSRTHSDDQIAKIVASIVEFGFNNPILLKDDNATIGAGHARCQAAIIAGLEAVPTITLYGLTDAQWRAYVIADNQLALTGAGWDEEKLKHEIDALGDLDFDISLIGFDIADLNRLIGGGKGSTDPEEIPAVQAVPISILGDIWTLGNHRLICGSSTDPEDVAAVLDGSVPHLMVTDPPYGVEYDPNWRNEAERADGTKIGAKAVGKVKNDEVADWRAAWALFPGDVAYIWHADRMGHIVAESLIATGFLIRAQIIWNKSSLVIGRGDYHPKHEPCWYAVRKGKTGHWQGSRKESTVWDIDKPQRSETGHGTQKPIECMKQPIENNSKEGDLVYEPFSGSGTTIIAGEMTGRHVRAVEIHPPYVDVAVRRWEGYTGQDAIHAATGKTFAEIEAERSPADQ